MALDLDTVRAFVRVAELGSFTRAAEQLGAPKARVSQQVQRLEAELGGQLLHRTTRHVRVTPDGAVLLTQAKALLADAEQLASMFSTERRVAGRVRVDLPVNLGRDVVMPRAPEFMAAHPDLELQVSMTDRLVDILREGFDAVVRVAALRDSALHATRLGALEMINCASADYVARHGMPRTPAALDDHLLVHYSSSLGADPPSFEWREGGRDRSRRAPARITVNGADAYTAACLAGLGIIQAPRLGVRAALASGELVELLPRHRAARLPVFLVHPHGARPPRRVRVVLDWIAAVLRPYLRRGGN